MGTISCPREYPDKSADLSLIPVWCEVLADQPDRVASILGDFLELRRVLAVHLIRTLLDRVSDAASLLPAVVQSIPVNGSLEDMIQADLAFSRDRA